MIVSPSILGCSRLNLKQEISDILGTGVVDMLHIDVFDGTFVPNFAWDITVVGEIYREFQVPMDIHLMIRTPHEYVKRFAEAVNGDSRSAITFHIESESNAAETIAAIRDAGPMAGIAMKPHTPIEAISSVVKDVDLVLQMTVDGGFGGQALIESALEKIPRIRELVGEKIIAIDGGVNAGNIERVCDLGVDLPVAGKAFWEIGKETFQRLKDK